MDLNLIWFVLLAALTMGYAILDGFDFGVGMIQPLLGDVEKRNLAIKAIGPLWDGNEVWLVTLGGALFAAFPEAYATIMSAFYLPVMALLCSLIVRAVSIDFRNKTESATWKKFWDAGFFFSSLSATTLFGLLVGNLIIGIPLDERGVFIGSLTGLLGVFPVLVALFAISVFLLHGTIFLILKTGESVRQTLVRTMWVAIASFLFFYLVTTFYAVTQFPQTTRMFREQPVFYGLVPVHFAMLWSVPMLVLKNKFGWAFVCSCGNIACLVVLFGLALFPNLVLASNSMPSLDIYNAASSESTLWLMLIFAMIGLPLISAYTVIVYWTFRGKVG